MEPGEGTEDQVHVGPMKTGAHQGRVGREGVLWQVGGGVGDSGRSAEAWGDSGRSAGRRGVTRQVGGGVG